MANSTVNTTTVAISTPLSWKGLAEKRHKGGKIAKALIGTASIAFVSVISLIAFSFIPIIPLIVISCLGLIGLIAIVVTIPLFLFFIFDGFALSNSTEYVKKPREQCSVAVQKIIDESFGEIKDNPEKNDHILDQASEAYAYYGVSSYLPLIREEIEGSDKTSSNMGRILNFDNNPENDHHIPDELESGLSQLEADFNNIWVKLLVDRFDQSQKTIIEGFARHMNAAFKLFSIIDIETPPLNEARVLFNIINKVRSEKSDDDHQMIKEQYETIDALFAYSKFLLGKALMQKAISETQSTESI